MTFDQLCSWQNLILAGRKACKGKRGRTPAARFEAHFEHEIYQLREELLEGRYTPGSYVSFYICEPKRRLISAAPFRDRVIHHALCQIIEPVFERSFIAQSYANRRGKGTHAALSETQRLLRRYRYVLSCDVRQFFPSIDHGVLTSILFKKIEDEDIQDLICSILSSGAGVLSGEYCMHYFPGDDLLARARPRGLPIGNLTSQFWANCYLSPFDHFVKRELRPGGYVRYVDDLLFFDDDRKRLWACLKDFTLRLESFRLAIHPGAHPKPREEGVSFLGFRNFPDYRRLKNRKAWHFDRHLRYLMLNEKEPSKITVSVRGWGNHCRIANTTGLRKTVFTKYVWKRCKALSASCRSSDARNGRCSSQLVERQY